MDTLPRAFVWQRFGVESGSDPLEIFGDKETQRRDSGGLFLSGAGNALGPGIRALIAQEPSPVMVSPMQSRPKRIDRNPPSVVSWQSAIDLDGQPWAIPQGVKCTSRGHSANAIKAKHNALVLRSAERLVPIIDGRARIDPDALCNIVRKTGGGGSQTTAVVERRGLVVDPRYVVGLVCELAAPYFVELRDPVRVG